MRADDDAVHPVASHATSRRAMSWLQALALSKLLYFRDKGERNTMPSANHRGFISHPV